MVVKAQIENECAPAWDQQVAMADQPQAIQTAPGSPNMATDQHAHTQDTAEVRTPAENQSTTVPSPSLAGNVPSTPEAAKADASGSGKPAHVDSDPGTSNTGASLSNLDKIGLGVNIIRTARATETTMEGEHPSTSEATTTQAAPTSQDLQDLFEGTDVSGLNILDIDVDGSEDFSEIDPEMADELLGGGPEEMIENWVAECNREVTAGLGTGIQPDLENGLQNLDLANETMASTAVGAAPSADHVLAAPNPPVGAKEGASEDMDATEGGPSNTVAQPGLVQHRRTFEIEGVDEFRREDGQPLFLNAYPPVTRPKEPKVADSDQAYRGQDLVDPSVIRPRHTCCERLRRQEEDQRRKQTGRALPTPVASAGMTERSWYSGAK